VNVMNRQPPAIEMGELPSISALSFQIDTARDAAAKADELFVRGEAA
jgi:hypothetical protein